MHAVMLGVISLQLIYADHVANLDTVKLNAVISS